MIIESIRLRWNKYLRKKYASSRSKKLINKDFTIISNNCWGGMVYEAYDLKKMSPTVGLYFHSSDYVEFLSKLDYYLNSEITFIEPVNSKYYKLHDKEKNFGSYPIGKIDDIEIYFMHYKSTDEALEKWNRRKKRINKEKLLVKFNDQNGCTEADLKKFLELPYKNKIFFTCKKWNIINNNVYIIKQSKILSKKNIMTSYEPFESNNNINIIDIINNL